MIILETPRLALRQLSFDDAGFIFELLNEPGWLRFIGDKGVRNLEDARDYIRTGPMASYERLGFGLYVVMLKDTGTPVGMCGLLKRDTLPDVDIGYAFLERHQGRGYAHEAAAAMIAHGRNNHGLERIVAITNADNVASAKVLGKIGMRFEALIPWEGGADVRLFALVQKISPSLPRSPGYEGANSTGSITCSP